MSAVGNEYRIVVLGDLSARIGGKVRESVIGSFGVPRENGNDAETEFLCRLKSMRCINLLSSEDSQISMG